MQLTQEEITRLQNSVKYLADKMKWWTKEEKEAHIRFWNRMSGGNSGFYLDENGELQHSLLVPKINKKDS